MTAIVPERLGEQHLSPCIRNEEAADADAIARLTEAAFRDRPYSSRTEHFIVDALRRHGQLTVSLVAVDGESIVGHVAVSPVSVSSGATGWFGLGPVSVVPECQGRGVGSALVQAALAELRRLGGLGCVLLGDPAYYRRFGFRPETGLVLPGVAPEYFQALSLGGQVPVGTVGFHDAFNATE